ncbi:hypothetical protein scyTo_0000780 [Scyliorhinus torazame]|uniref:Uncharacterized protein n=1 Tax=Scyliorhinus torazame TaxID=75743 RepID=A0A401P3Y5_SCYTO|nr:hypothetical protein [Scyliorhinus torazame]
MHINGLRSNLKNMEDVIPSTEEQIQTLKAVKANTTEQIEDLTNELRESREQSVIAEESFHSKLNAHVKLLNSSKDFADDSETKTTQLPGVLAELNKKMCKLGKKLEKRKEIKYLAKTVKLVGTKVPLLKHELQYVVTVSHTMKEEGGKKTLWA